MKHVDHLISSIRYISLTLTLAACGTQQMSTQSGGAPLQPPSGRAAQATSDYQGVVMITSSDGYLCTGVIIGYRAVLTAAHCLLNPVTYTAYTPKGPMIAADLEVNGPGTATDDRDIGILYFAQDIVADAHHIYKFADTAAVGEIAVVVGYGCTNTLTRLGAGIKRFGTNVISGISSSFMILRTPIVTARRIIGDSAQSGTCFGDSGGPLFVFRNGELAIAGITHAGSSDGYDFISYFVNMVHNVANRSFVADQNTRHHIGVDYL